MQARGLLNNRNGGVAYEALPSIIVTGLQRAAHKAGDQYKTRSLLSLLRGLLSLIGHTLEVAESAIVFDKNTMVGQLSALPAMDWQDLIVA